MESIKAIFESRSREQFVHEVGEWIYSVAAEAEAEFTSELWKSSERVPSVFAGPDDWIETPQTSRRGYIVCVTDEMIAQDQTRMLREKVREAVVLVVGARDRMLKRFADANQGADVVYFENWPLQVYESEITEFDTNTVARYKISARGWAGRRSECRNAG